MSVENILLEYHRDHIGKQEAMELIQDLIDAERITLRDEFAGKAMTALIQSGSWAIGPGPSNSNDLCSGAAYAMADSMLGWRNK